MLQPYPTSLAPEDWQVVIALLKGQRPAGPRAAAVCYNAIGYALGQYYPDVTPAPVLPPAWKNATSDVDLALGLEQWQKVSPAVKAAIGFGWLALIEALLRILPLFLKEQPA